MELENIEQVDFESIKNDQFDVLMVVSGYENRCTYLAEHFSAKPLTKIVFAFTERRKDGFRPGNDEFFRDLNFDFRESSGSTGNEIQKSLEELSENINHRRLKILVDYSCMTKEWYATIVNYFVNWDLNVQEVELYFSYTPSVFEKSKRTGILKRLTRKPVDQVFETQNKPVSLVLGLGYNQDPAIELIRRIRPARTFVFYSDPSIDNRFVKEVEMRNKELLKGLAPENIFRYPMNDLKKINLSLKELCMDIRLDSQVILAPLGPKPFALSCMLLSARYPDIWVWRVHSGDSDQYYDWKPFGTPLVCKAVFKNDDDDGWNK